MSNAIIYEQGNGLPVEGDYCGGEGCLWLVESIDSRIQTGDPRGNYVYATVSEADWEDCSEDDEFPARVSTSRDVEREVEPDDDEETLRADYEARMAQDER